MQPYAVYANASPGLPLDWATFGYSDEVIATNGGAQVVDKSNTHAHSMCQDNGGARERRRMQTRMAQRRYRERKKRQAEGERATGKVQEPTYGSQFTDHGSSYGSAGERNTADDEEHGDVQLFGQAETMWNSYVAADAQPLENEGSAPRLDCTVESSTAGALVSAYGSEHTFDPSGSCSSLPVYADTATSVTTRSSTSIHTVTWGALIKAADEHGHLGIAMTTYGKRSLLELMQGHVQSRFLHGKTARELAIPRMDFFRAFFANALALTFSPADFSKCRTPSRIGELWRQAGASLSTHLPENMHPVQEQFDVVHNIVIDILPWPETRRRILRSIKAGVLEQDAFKSDLFFGTDAEKFITSPFRVHGASSEATFSFNALGAAEVTMDPESWECSGSWLEKYWFLVDENVVRRTNWWRRNQGLDPVRIAAVQGNRASIAQSERLVLVDS